MTLRYWNSLLCSVSMNPKRHRPTHVIAHIPRLTDMPKTESWTLLTAARQLPRRNSASTNTKHVVGHLAFCCRRGWVKGPARSELSHVRSPASTTHGASLAPSSPFPDASLLPLVRSVARIYRLNALQPVLLWEMSKSVLDMSLKSDTTFLTQNDLMDYSLLCGVERGSQQLVVG